MFLQPHELGAEPASLPLAYYLCWIAVIVICFAIAIKKCGDFDGD